MTTKAARGTTSGVERRAYAVELEVRKASATGGPVHVVGYASTTESPYQMNDMFGPYTEVVSRGAFGKTIAKNADGSYQSKVQLLVNHGGLSLAATTAGTLDLREDDTGLEIDATLNPARRDAADLICALEDRAVDEMSFAFRVVRQTWSPDYEERRIDEVNMNRGDVSCVNLGANPNTPVAMRSADLDRYLDSLEGDELRAALARLNARLAAPATPVLRGMSLDTARALIG